MILSNIITQLLHCIKLFKYITIFYIKWYLLLISFFFQNVRDRQVCPEFPNFPNYKFGKIKIEHTSGLSSYTSCVQN